MTGTTASPARASTSSRSRFGASRFATARTVKPDLNNVTQSIEEQAIINEINQINQQGVAIEQSLNSGRVSEGTALDQGLRSRTSSLNQRRSNLRQNLSSIRSPEVAGQSNTFIAQPTAAPAIAPAVTPTTILIAPTSGTTSYRNPRQLTPRRNFSPRTVRIATPRVTTVAQQQVETAGKLTDAARANAIARRNNYAEQITGLQNELSGESVGSARKSEIENEVAQLTQNIIEIDQQIGYVVAAAAQ